MTYTNHAMVRSLLFSEEQRFREVGLQMVLRDFPDTDSLAVEYLFECSSDLLDTYRENLIRYFPFLGNPFAAPLNHSTAHFKHFDFLAREFERFISSIKTVMPHVSQADRKQTIARLALLPGIRYEVQHLIETEWGSRQAKLFAQQAEDEISKRSRKQIMMFLTYRCNLKCPYCFASDLKADDMPAEKAMEIISQAHEEGINTITYCGGEPTLYPDFSLLLDRMKQEGIQTYFATNLLSPPKVLKKLSPDYVRALIVHVAHPQVYQGDQWDIFKKNVQSVRKKKIPVGFRINIYSDQHDWSHLFELIDQTDVKDIQLAFAFPNTSGSNRHTTIKDVQRLIPSMLDFMDKCRNSDVRVVFSKPVPLCLFPEERSRELIRYIEYLPKCSVHEDHFTHNVCFSPQGDVSPCLSMMDCRHPFSSFEQWEDVSRFCRSHILPLLSATTTDACHHCFLYYRRICQGACLGHKRSMEPFVCH